MKSFKACLFILGLMHGYLAHAQPKVVGKGSWLSHPSQQDLDEGLVVANSYLVAFRNLPDLTQPQLQNLHSRKKSFQFIRDNLVDFGVQSLSLLASLNLSEPGKSFLSQVQLPGPAALEMYQGRIPADLATIASVEFDSFVDADETLQRWYQEGRIWYAEPNYISKVDGDFEQGIIQNFNDATFFPWLNQINYIEAFQFLDANPPSESPVIAVLDSGVDVLHPSLENNIYVNANGQNKLCLDDIYGCDTTETRKEILGRGTVYPASTTGFGQSCIREQSNCSHGTHVAGIISARSTDYMGICPYCRILVVKVVGIKNEGGVESFVIEDRAIIAGLAYVSGFTVGGEPLVRVINASFGKFQKSRSVGLFINALKGFGRGILTVAAAGNEDTMKRQYPAAFDDVIAVANINSNASNPVKSGSSNFGLWVDLAAPGSGFCSPGGGGVLSSVPGGLSYCSEGTSMSSPIVAGVAGLVLASEPELSAREVEARLLNTANPDDLYRDGMNDAYRPQIEGKSLVPLLGAGIVNASGAVDASQAPSEPVFSSSRSVVQPGCGSLAVAAGGSPFGLFLLLPLGLYLLRFFRQ